MPNTEIEYLDSSRRIPFCNPRKLSKQARKPFYPNRILQQARRIIFCLARKAKRINRKLRQAKREAFCNRREHPHDKNQPLNDKPAAQRVNRHALGNNTETFWLAAGCFCHNDLA